VLRFADGFDLDSIRVVDLSPHRGRESDPLYVVEARAL
jgi:hypothetical protein